MNRFCLGLGILVAVTSAVPSFAQQPPRMVTIELSPEQVQDIVKAITFKNQFLVDQLVGQANKQLAPVSAEKSKPVVGEEK